MGRRPAKRRRRIRRQQSFSSKLSGAARRLGQSARRVLPGLRRLARFALEGLRRFLSWFFDPVAWRRPLGRAQRVGFVVVLLLLAALLERAGPPDNPQDLCSIFQEKRSWYKAARNSHQSWAVPEAVQMAMLYQESSFRAHARPPRRRILWVIPWLRPTSAYGYGQVLDATWADYQAATGRLEAKRYDFSEVAHFVGWYSDHIHRRTGIAKDDAYELYLAYHEGPAGYLSGSHQQKPWLLQVARRVEERARHYADQYAGCRAKLESWWWWLG